MHISKRDEIPVWKAWTIRLLAILAALIVFNVIGMINAAKGKAKELPLFGHLAEKMKSKDR